MKVARTLFVLSLAAISAAASTALAQSADKPDTRTTETVYLVNGQENNGNEILTGLRNIVDSNTRVYLDPSANAIVIHGTPEQLAEAHKVIAALDRPRKLYRLTYTIRESDGGKLIGVQHCSMVVSEGARSTLKQGSKIPIATGSYDQGKNGAQTQFTYLDIGLNFDSTVDTFSNGLRLKAKVEQSSIASETTIAGINEPVIRQSVLEQTAQLVLDKPLVLGSLDITGSTRHLDIEALAETIR